MRNLSVFVKIKQGIAYHLDSEGDGDYLRRGQGRCADGGMHWVDNL